jgi:hypothetical protein
MREPFEGDTLLASWMAATIAVHEITCVVETGTETGATANQFAKWVDKVYTCDLEDKWDRHPEDNVSFSLCASHRMLDNMLPLYAARHKILFYLDAHVAPGFTALPRELEIIAQQSLPDCVIVIHDFRVPGHPELGFDTYDEYGPLCLDLVRPWMNRVFPGGYAVHYNGEAKGAMRGVGVFVAA